MGLIALILELLKIRNRLEPAEREGGGPTVRVMLGKETYTIAKTDFYIGQPWGDPVVTIHLTQKRN